MVDTPAITTLLERAAAGPPKGRGGADHWTTSAGLAIDRRPLEDLSTAMTRAGGRDTPVWSFWVEQEFMLWGLLPDPDGPGQHGALLARQSTS